MSDLEAILETGSVAAVEIAASAMAERGQQVHPCPNCGKPMIGAFCAMCGQPQDVNRRSVWGLVKVLVEDIVSFDSRIMRTSWALVAKPGELASAFREGRTQRYLPALRLYLFVSVIFFIVLGASNLALVQLVVIAQPQKITWINGEPYVANPAYDKSDPDTQFLPKMIKLKKEKLDKAGHNYDYMTKIYFFAPIGAYHTVLTPEERARLSGGNINIDIDPTKTGKPLTPEQTKKIELVKSKAKAVKGWIQQHLTDGYRRLMNDPAALNNSLTAWLPRTLFVLMPLYAMLLALFYVRHRKKFFFVDHLIFSLTIHTFGFVLLLAAAGAAQIFPGATVAFASMIVAGLYTLIATRNFYHQNWFWTVVKFASVSFFYICFCALPALGVVLVLSFLNV